MPKIIFVVRCRQTLVVFLPLEVVSLPLALELLLLLVSPLVRGSPHLAQPYLGTMAGLVLHPWVCHTTRLFFVLFRSDLL